MQPPCPSSYTPRGLCFGALALTGSSTWNLSLCLLDNLPDLLSGYWNLTSVTPLLAAPFHYCNPTTLHIPILHIHLAFPTLSSFKSISSPNMLRYANLQCSWCFVYHSSSKMKLKNIWDVHYYPQWCLRRILIGLVEWIYVFKLVMCLLIIETIAKFLFKVL